MSDAQDVEAAFDPSALERLVRFGGASLLGEMVDLFEQEAPSRLTRACEATEHGDLAHVEASMHSLRSSAAQLGLVDVARLCADGESLSREGDATALGPVVTALRIALPQGISWMRTVYHETPR